MGIRIETVQIVKQATSFVNALATYRYFKKDSKIPRVAQVPIDFLMFAVDLVGVLGDIAVDFIPGKEGAITKMRRLSATFDKREQGLEGDICGLETGSQALKPVKEQAIKQSS